MKNFIAEHKVLSSILFAILLLFLIFIIWYVVVNYSTKKKSDFENLTDELLQPKNYSVNEYSSLSITNQTMAKIYLIDFINNIDYNIEIGYSLLDQEYRNSKFGSLDSFITYVNNTNFSTTLDKYYVEGNKYYVFDSNGNEYIFVVDGVMGYRVYLDEDTVSITTD